MLIIWIGVLLVVCGLVYMVVYEALRRGRLSGTVRPEPVPDGTLEPRRHGVGFLGLTGNWPGFALMGAGFLLMLVGAFLSTGTTTPGAS